MQAASAGVRRWNLSRFLIIAAGRSSPVSEERAGRDDSTNLGTAATESVLLIHFVNLKKFILLKYY